MASKAEKGAIHLVVFQIALSLKNRYITLNSFTISIIIHAYYSIRFINSSRDRFAHISINCSHTELLYIVSLSSHATASDSDCDTS